MHILDLSRKVRYCAVGDGANVVRIGLRRRLFQLLDATDKRGHLLRHPVFCSADDANDRIQ
eukprot:55323-Lingulodinium_polyedra.AAC.1